MYIGFSCWPPATVRIALEGIETMAFEVPVAHIPGNGSSPAARIPILHCSEGSHQVVADGQVSGTSFDH